MDSVTSMPYLDAIISVSQQRQGMVLQKLIQVQAEAVSVQAKPLKPISPSMNKVDVYA